LHLSLNEQNLPIINYQDANADLGVGKVDVVAARAGSPLFIAYIPGNQF
jgi:hypothetical protein